MKNKIYKLLSIVLAIMVVFSCCSVAFTVFAEETITATYYINAETGNDETGTGMVDAPFLTVKAAINQATTDGHNVAGKTVAIHVSNPSNITSVDTLGNDLPAADCDLVIMADAAQTRLHDSNSGIAFVGSGSITFKNIYLSAKQYSNITFGNKNVSFDSGSRIESGSGGGYTAMGKFEGGTITTPVYFDIACQSTPLYICNPQSDGTFSNGIYITYDSAANSQTFYFGCPRTDRDSYASFTKPVNFNIKSAKGVTFGTAVGSTRFIEDGVIQVINSSGVALSGLDTIVVAKAGAKETYEQDDTPVTKWILTNQTTEFKNAIDFTDTVGLYDVAEGYTVVATKVDDSSVVVTSAAAEGSQDVMLDLREYGAGEYNLTVERNTHYAVTYYVSSTGDDNAEGTEEAPLLTVEGAIKKANAADYGKTDTVYVKVLGTTGVLWKTYSAAVLPAYTYTLDISSATSGATVGAKNDVVTSSRAELNGPTKFSNIKIANLSSNGYIGFGFYNNNVEFGEGVTYEKEYITYQLGVWNSSNTANSSTYKKDQNVVVNGANFKYLNLGNNYGGATFDGNITITVNNASATPYFYLSCNNAKATYNANVNFNFKQASSITFTKNSGGSHAFGENAAIQIINSSGKAVTSTTGELANITAPKYILTNSTGDKELLDFTSVAGTYKVNADLGFYTVKATSADGATVYTAKDGLLVIETAGEYDISIEKFSNLKATYYISAEGSDDNNGLTADKPFLTLKKAVDTAIAKGYTTSDTVTVKTIGSTAVASGLDTRGSLAAYGFKLVITANDTAVPGKISGYLGFRGETEVTYITTTGNVGFNGFNITFGEGAKVSYTDNETVFAIGHINNTGISVSTKAPTNVKIDTYNSNKFYFCGCYYNTATYNYPLTIEINKYTPYYNDTIYGGIVLSTGGKTAVTGVYNAAVNIKINNATTNVIPFKSETTTVTYGENFAFQFINASDKPLGKTGDTLKRNDSHTSTLTSALDSMPEGKVYVLDNKTGNDDLVTFTDTVGTYAVNVDTEMYNVTATSTADASVVFTAKDGYLTVDPGEYTIAFTKKSNLNKTYYVGGTDASDETGDGTEAKPFATVTKAVDFAIAKGYGESDTVYVKTIGEAVEMGALSTKYAFNLNVDSNDQNVKTKITVSVSVANNEGATTTYGNVTLYKSGDWGRYEFNNSNVVFSDKTSLSHSYLTTVYGSWESGTNIAGQSVVYNCGTPYSIILSNGGYSTRNYTEDVNLVINNATSNPFIGLNAYYAGAANGTTTYSKNVNINLKSLSGVRIYQTNGVTVKGAIQIIDSAEVGFDKVYESNVTGDADPSIRDALAGFTNVYLITNELDADAISFVPSVAGKYAIDVDTERYNVYAVDAEGNKVADLVDGYITLAAAGEYTIKADVIAANKEIYVQNGATEGDGTSEKPFATVAEAINAANDKNLTTGDVVTVKVMGETAAEWGTGAEEYTFLLKVVSNDTENKGTVIANQRMTGDVEFDYITVESTRSNTDNPYRVVANGHNLTLGTNATTEGYFEIVAGMEQKTLTAQDIAINGPYTQYLHLGYSNAGYLTYTGDVNVVINNANAQPGIEFMGHYGGDVTYNANLNINVKDAKSLAIAETSVTIESGTAAYEQGRRSGVASVKGAAQLILPGYTTISDDSIANFKALNADNYYIVRNNTGDEIGFTETAGVYTVSGNDTVYVYKNGVEVAQCANGTLDLASLGAGEYVLIKTREAQTFNYTNADGATIADMISKAIANGAIEGDTLKITLTGTTAVAYGTPVEHLFDVEIISTENTPVSFVSEDILKGDTKFDGVNVSYPGGENTLWFGYHDVEMTAATTVSGGYYFGLGAKNESKTVGEQNVKIDCYTPIYITLSGDWCNTTRTGALNLSLGNPSVNPVISFGFHGTNTYADVNIDLGKTTDTSFKYIGDGSHVFTGSVNIIGENPIKDTAYLDGLSANVYTVYNKTGVEGILGFGAEGGKFTVSGEKTVRAISANAYTDSVDGVLTLETEGNYYVGIPSDYSGDVTTNDQYIVDRTALNGKHALNNVAAKIANGEALNVVYYGGSVTAGSGASVADKTSWRGLIGSWLEINAPGSKVTNVNSAIGGTGSYFGYYRLDEAVIAHQPDLVFIEFSINDYYDNQDIWNIGEDQAAAQFESIVRKLRTELPDCDIVTVLTTDRDQVSALQNNDALHAQAKGHDKIAAKYGIPSLRVGHALADHLAATGEAWEDYVTDIVHPRDNGYRIYANVIEEYLAESLLGTRNKDAVVTAHTVPENIVSDKIWAGDVSFISADANLSAESASLGGSKFAVNRGADNGRSYAYHENFYAMNDTEKVLKFKFTGTELSILEDQYSNGYKGVNVKIDGGEEYFVEFRGYRPTVIASGLDNREHTAEVRIAQRVDGQTGSQWVYGFFVRDEAQDLIKPAMEGTYYVSADGDDDANTGLKTDSALKTVKAAIQKAKDDGYGARDKVYIKVIGTTAVDFGADNNTMPTHSFKLNVSSYTSGATVGVNDGSITIGGHTDFENITVHVATWDTYATMLYNDYDVNFLQGTTVKNINVSTFALGTGSTNNTITRPTNITFDGAVYDPGHTLSVKLSNDWNYKTYNAPINVTFNNSAIKTYVYFGASNGITTYNDAVNINVENATSVYLSGAGEHPPTFGDKAAVQVINSASATLSISETVANALGDKYWVINNNSGIKDLLSFTDTVGKYRVNVDTNVYVVTATSVDGEKSTVAGNGTLNLADLGAGEYNISVTKLTEYKEYYVQTGATGGDGSEEKPFATVMEAVEAAKTAGYTTNDEVTVNLIGTEAVEWGTAVDYSFLLKVVSSNTENKSTVNATVGLSGDVTFENVVVNGKQDQYETYKYRINYNGYDVTFGNGVSTNVTDVNMSAQNATNDAQTIGFDIGYASRVMVGNYNQNNVTYNGDVNIRINNASAKPSFTFMASYGGIIKFKKNLNLLIQDAASLSFGTTTKEAGASGSGIQQGGVQVTGAVQMVVPGDITIDTTSLANFKSLTDNYYIIKNNTDKADAISFTETAGELAIDIGDIKYEGYYAVVTNDLTGGVTLVKGDTVALEPGEYTVTISRDPLSKEYTITGGTLADAVQTAIDEGYGYGDDVTFKLGTLEEINVGKLPRYNFNLVIESEVQTRLVLNDSREIANNKGAHTHFKNVEVYNENEYSTINLAGSSATFDKDSKISSGGYCTLTFGTSADDKGTEVLDSEQKVVLDCVAPSYISLSSWLYAAHTYNDDVTLVINNANSDTQIWFNAYSEGAVNGTTRYRGNLNINVKAAKAIKFDNYDNVSFNYTSYVQLILNENTSVAANDDGYEWLKKYATYGYGYYLVDKTFQRGIFDFTDETGVFAVEGEYDVTALRTEYEYYDGNGMVKVPDGKTTVLTEQGKLDLSGVKDGSEGTGTWELTTDEYFEDFNDKTVEELKADWKFSSDSSAVEKETAIVNGELNIVTQDNVKELLAFNQNKNIESKEQYISMDMHGTDFGYYNGLQILARQGGNHSMEAYSFHISSPFIALTKYDGTKNTGGYYQSNTSGFDMDGLWGRIPGSQAVKNEYSFNSNHTYRVSFSITTDYENGNEIAFVRGIVLNLNTNEVMFDETFKDTEPYVGTEFSFVSPGTGSDVYLDNLYFSSKGFREGDEGILDGDINGDGTYDVRDLVYAEENSVESLDRAILNKADKNVSGAIDGGDYDIIIKEILSNLVLGEFNRTGATDAEADAMRNEILNTTSGIVTEGGKTYYTASNGIKEEITGNIWYVSSKATGTGNAGTEADPWTFEELQAQVKPDNSDTYKNRLVGKGDAVLFERGSVFRTNNLMRDESTSGQTSDCYAYLMMSEGTLYGAYGEGNKPKFIDSYKNYADETWSAVEDQENVWVIDAPEIVIDREGNERVANGNYNGDNSATNIIFNDGEKIGQRRAFPDSARNGGKVYTIFKDGQFTYDEVNGNLYLYSEANPNTYDSIEVSRALYAIQVNSHESNIVVDNLAFRGFAKGAVGSNFGSNYMSVTNCAIGYSGGTFMGDVRGGNAVGLWGGGSHIEVNYNWIYQTWDSAISPQGNRGFDYTGFQVIGNLLEYNNADIEIFDRGTNSNTGKGAVWDDVVISDNLMRFTTLGWGSREADKIRGIQGVIRGGVAGASSVDIDWNNNTIDSPGMEIIRFDNTTSFTQEGEGDTAVVTTTGIFKFGANGSTMDGNTYYYNPYVRNTSLAVREYMTAVPADYKAQYGEAENTGRHAKTAADFYDAMRAFDIGANSKFFWGGVQVTSGN